MFNKPYLEYVSQFTNQEEVNSILFMSMSIDCNTCYQISQCVGFSAMSAANRNRKGLRATGIGAVSCARNEMYRPNGMGDLQFGEKYANSVSVLHIEITYINLFRFANMDFIMWSSIAGDRCRRVCCSYDISCQWCIYWFDRLNRSTTPEYL